MSTKESQLGFSFLWLLLNHYKIRVKRRENTKKDESGWSQGDLLVMALRLLFTLKYDLDVSSTREIPQILRNNFEIMPYYD